MKRLHVHVAVDDLEASTAFYANLFAAQPSVRMPDYAKWMLDDPRVNFAISARGAAPGLDHLGIQVETAADLAAISARLRAAGECTQEQKAAKCCYAFGDKTWTRDPGGLRWETFHSTGEAVTYGEDLPVAAAASACCGTPAG